MNVGIVGLGKLGLPVAVAMASRGLDVYGYDIQDPDITGAVEHEEGFREAYIAGKERLHFVPLEKVVSECEVIFCAVQTPHELRFEGIRPLPEDRADFDYSYLVQAAKDVTHECEIQGARRTLAVISTVLPGTMDRVVRPAISSPNVKLVYNPSFIAMGTTIQDFLDPEFVLLGGDDPAREEVFWLYRNLGIHQIRCTSIPNAELIKVAYNTFIGLKLAFANTLLEVCHKTNCDVEHVTGALKLATRRLISPAYMDAGMGDGGGCHPRDNIALSWLARELNLSHDLFEDIMLCREDQSEWLVEMVDETCKRTGLEPALLGVAYKPASHITTGSPAMLAWVQLMRTGSYMHRGIDRFDPYVTEPGVQRHKPDEPRVFLVGCKHPDFPEWELPKGSVVIDPWRYIPDQDGVEVIRVGEHSPSHDRASGDGREVRPIAA